MGHRRLLLVAVTMVAAGSLLIAARPTTATLAVGMVLQSAVVGFFPLLAGILRSRSPEHGRIGMSVLVGALLLSIGTGGFVAGTLSDEHALAGLWTAVPFGALALAAAFTLPTSTAPRAGRFNVPAALLLTFGLGTLMLVLTKGGSWGWTSASSLLTGAAALVLMVGWVLVEQRSAHPLVDLGMLRDPGSRRSARTPSASPSARSGSSAPTPSTSAPNRTATGSGSGSAPRPSPWCPSPWSPPASSAPRSHRSWPA
ncbi:hypothetical protein DN402_33900 [Streptomyces sp. SW4]|nr:hypothetical protein DN402_33900 [Streptomyces sp. SW4]